VGNVAALTEHKDHDTLIRAAAQVVERQPRARFVIVGDGELREPLTALAASLGLAEHVVFTGFRRDIDRLMPAFDVFCLSSILEGLGTSLLDAMSFSRPIVATRAGGISEAVADGETGLLVVPRDIGGLAVALLELLNDADRREAYGVAGRQRFDTHFTAERMVEETLTVYEELLA
jgi:glycosyltransferase involved in cell wall biosynthesis